MEAIREIIDSSLIEGVINLPENFRNHKLEITIIPISEKTNIKKEDLVISDSVKAISGIIDLKGIDYQDFIAEERLKDYENIR
ncbi:MAG TPA: hypothetical protein DHW82_11115 [Spirochaetia bacterium]|nr:MAG: hypothetical protein A2Y41_01060 [Spirochaetes bacterium GWB1_36_13]HCL57542.1 hypothetical protein [Spirochaetia bacterium]